MTFSGGFLRATLLFCILGVYCPNAASQQNSSPPSKGESGFKDGQLLEISDAYDPYESTKKKAAYLFKIQGGSEIYHARYTVTIFEHDRSKSFEAGKPIEYRVDGKHIYLKAKDGEKIKASLCQERGNCVVCGSTSICGIK